MPKSWLSWQTAEDPQYFAGSQTLESKTAKESAVDRFTDDLWDGRKRRQRLGAVLGLIVVAVFGFYFWFIPNVGVLRRGPVTVKRWVKARGEILAIVGPGLPGWTESRRVSRHLLDAVVSAEDQRFYYHHGIDPGEMLMSLRTNWQAGRYVRGGSTLTQQVVKMSLLYREKSLIRKAREVLGAIHLEWILSKADILEWYVNLAEFGDNVYGVREASQHYFRTRPELLTIAQAIHLALVLPSPNGWSVGLRRRSLTSFGHRRFASIAIKMRRAGMITDAQLRTVLATGNFGNPIAGYEPPREPEETPEDPCSTVGDCGSEGEDADPVSP